MPTPSERTRQKADGAEGSTPSERGSERGGTSRSRTTARPPAKKAAARRPAAQRPSAVEIARLAMQQLVDLTGRDPEGVTRLTSADDGWTVDIEVVESHRIPDSTDILATYEVRVDKDGQMTGYERTRRYARGRAGDG